MFWIKNPKAFICVLIGLPAAGKSTLAKGLQEYYLLQTIYHSIKRIDPDIYRKQIMGDEFTPDLESNVRTKKMEMLTQLVQPGNFLIIDDTNYYSIYLKSDLSSCMKWNAIREKPLPNTVLKEHAQKFDEPGSKYAWDKPSLVVNPTKFDPEKLTLIVGHEIIQYLLIQKLYYENRIPSSVNFLKNQNHRDQPLHESNVRDLFHEIITRQIDSSSINDIAEIFNIQFNPRTWKKDASRLIVPLKNAYISYLIKQSLEKPELSNFLQFLRNTYQK